ncbi:MAG: beta-N-acetylhexosaminidase [Rhodospirillales bacterium]|nr:beta-N-acetylhexosaminidase [Alphaproteobacteria bacterium]MCB9987595.1 beta-N-acetylhexosaminidase [Rhodospirillales bacterium]USO07690.1 MAG: beta-N-acetylhexosaminidase [Rhodospirillales bacterium]
MSFAADTAPIIFGCTGTELGDDEAAFFRDAKPAGFILFRKNCETPDQVARLCAALRETVGWAAPILIDQEGGRVQRLRPPHWPDFPPPRTFAEHYATDPDAGLAAVSGNYAALARTQAQLGVDVNCVPCLDVVPADNAVPAIGDRSFGSDPDIVAALGLAAARASFKAGATPVMKHMPGHGRAVVDSHFELPRVDAPLAALERDWQPFRHLAAHMPRGALWGMSAHVIYATLDPNLPATLSPKIITEIVRGKIGFHGLLCTDDLFMDALAPYGDVPERARLALKAGNDLALHCHGDILAREKAIAVIGRMSAATRERLEDWIKSVK